MISSTALLGLVLTPCGREVEVYPHTHEGPAPAIAAPGGASKTALSTNTMKEHATYGSQGTRPRHEDDDDRPAGREDHHDHSQGRRWFPMTAVTTGMDLRAVERDIAAVLVAHGLADHDAIQVGVHEIEQGGLIAGVTVSAFAYTRPASLPASKPHTGDPFDGLVEHLLAEVAS